MKLMTDRNWFAYEIKKQTKQTYFQQQGQIDLHNVTKKKKTSDKKIQKRKSFRTSKDNNYIT